MQRWYRLTNGEEGFLEAAEILAELVGIPIAEIDSDPESAYQAARERQRRKERQLCWLLIPSAESGGEDRGGLMRAWTLSATIPQVGN